MDLDPVKKGFRKLKKQDKKLIKLAAEIAQGEEELGLLKIKYQLAFNKYVLAKHGSFQELNSARIAVEEKSDELWVIQDKELRTDTKRWWLHRRLLEINHLTA